MKPLLNESKEMAPHVIESLFSINIRNRVVVLALALCCAGCAATERHTDGASSAETGVSERVPPGAAEWNSQPDPDLALDFFVTGSLLEDNEDFDGAKAAFEQAILHDDNSSIFAALARSHIHTGNAYSALVFAEESVKRAPEKTEYRRQLAQLYTLLGENDSAAIHLQVVIAQDPSDIQARYSLAQMYDDTDPERALELYEDLQTRMGDDWNLATRLAELYSQLGRLPEAAEALETLLRIDSRNAVVMQTLGTISIRLRNYERALALYQALVERNPDVVAYRLGLAEIYLHQNNWDGAMQSMRKALDLPGIDTSDALRIGEIYFQQAVSNRTRNVEALDAVSLLRKNYPGEWKPAWYLGALMFNNGKYAQAVGHFNDALKINPGNVQTLDVLARAYMTMGAYNDAVRTQTSIIELGAAKSETYLHLGYAYTRLARPGEAIVALEKAVELDPMNLEAVTTLASLYDDREEYEKSGQIFDRAIAAFSGSGKERPSAYYVLLNNYAYALSERGVHLDRAIKMAEEAVAGEPKNSSFLDTIGWIHFKSGNYAEARTYIEEAMQARHEEGGKPGAVLYDHLGDVYLELGDSEQAARYWEKALEQDPENNNVKRKLHRDQ